MLYKKIVRVGTYVVVVRFITDKNDIVSDVQPETTNGDGMEQEVLRVITTGHMTWTPAQHGGSFPKNTAE